MQSSQINKENFPKAVDIINNIWYSVKDTLLLTLSTNERKLITIKKIENRTRVKIADINRKLKKFASKYDINNGAKSRPRPFIIKVNKEKIFSLLFFLPNKFEKIPKIKGKEAEDNSILIPSKRVML